MDNFTPKRNDGSDSSLHREQLVGVSQVQAECQSSQFHRENLERESQEALPLTAVSSGGQEAVLGCTLGGKRAGQGKDREVSGSWRGCV